MNNIDEETRNPLAEAEFVMIVELQGKMVERVYAVPVENVEEIVDAFINTKYSTEERHIRRIEEIAQLEK